MKQNRFASLVGTLTLLAGLAGVSQADDWPHWRGPQRNGISAETGWLDQWPAGGPPVAWKAAVGTGFSSFAVAGGRVFTMGHAGGNDTVFCLDAETGKEIWKHSYPAALGDNLFEGGPTATPTVEGGRVYTLSRWGDVFCFDAVTGKVHWSKNVQKETEAPVPQWGFSGSPVPHDNLLLLDVGEAGLALEKATGRIVWQSAKKEAGYSTPLPLQRGGARLAASYDVLSKKFAGQVDVPADRKFIGFDAYKKAIDLLRPGDVAMLTGYAGWRPQQLEYAVAKGVNVFMEKSFACDPPGVRRIIKAGEEAAKKNLKIAAGLMARHSRNRQELIKRIRDGELGEIQFVRTFRMQPCGTLRQRKPEEKELDWQISHFTHFLWVSGGLFAEMNIHQVDEICWVKDAWPVFAHGVGGRVANSADCGQNLDSLSIEWTFADGTKAYHVTRWLQKCHSEFATYIHGTKRAGIFPWLSGRRGEVQIYNDQRIAPDNVYWKAENEGYDTHWQAEWNVLFEAIRKDKPHNEAKRAALSNLADIMGRAAVHSGKLITWDEAMASNFQFCPNIESLDENSPPPLKADAQGRYPVPIPGQWTEI